MGKFICTILCDPWNMIKSYNFKIMYRPLQRYIIPANSVLHKGFCGFLLNYIKSLHKSIFHNNTIMKSFDNAYKSWPLRPKRHGSI